MELTNEDTNNCIKKLEKEIEKLNEQYFHKDINPPTHRAYRHIELLKAGITEIEEINDGFLVNGKFVIAAKKNRWRINGKWNWYWFKNIPDFVERYVHAD